MLKGKSVHHLTLAVTALFFFLSSLDLQLTTETIALSIAVFIGTFFIYRLSVWVPVISFSRQFISFYFKPNIFELVSYFFVLLSTCYFLTIRELALLSFWGLFSTCYFLNLKSGAFHFRGLRSIPIIKTIHLSLLWSIIGFIFKMPEVVLERSLLYDFIIRFIILFIICLGVDLRDISKDKDPSEGFAISTVATYLGFEKLKLLMLIVTITLICFLLLSSTNLTLELVIASILFIGIISLKINSSPKTFTILMDGTLMLYSFLALMMQLTCF